MNKYHHGNAVIPENVSFTFSTTYWQSVESKKIVIWMMIGGGS